MVCRKTALEEVWLLLFYGVCKEVNLWVSCSCCTRTLPIKGAKVMRRRVKSLWHMTRTLNCNNFTPIHLIQSWMEIEEKHMERIDWAVNRVLQRFCQYLRWDTKKLSSQNTRLVFRCVDGNWFPHDAAVLLPLLSSRLDCGHPGTFLYARTFPAFSYRRGGWGGVVIAITPEEEKHEKNRK